MYTILSNYPANLEESENSGLFRRAATLEGYVFDLKRGELNLNPQDIKSLDYIKKSLDRCEEEVRRKPSTKHWFDKVRADLATIPTTEGKKAARLRSRKKILCPICLETKKLADTFQLNCRHQFCKRCLVSALDKENKDCAYCRTPIEIVEGDLKYRIQWYRDYALFVDPLPDEEQI